MLSFKLQTVGKVEAIRWLSCPRAHQASGTKLSTWPSPPLSLSTVLLSPMREELLREELSPCIPGWCVSQGSHPPSGASAQGLAGLRKHAHQRWSLGWARKCCLASSGQKVVSKGQGGRDLGQSRDLYSDERQAGTYWLGGVGQRGQVQEEPFVASGPSHEIRSLMMEAAAQSRCCPQ